jgi:predicted metal-dependent phosphoesterase TrpH
MKFEFAKPDIEKLRKEGYYCADMHFHTNHSDGSATVEEALEKAKALGIGLSITDHNEISGSLAGGKDVVPGIEVKSRELVDILFYFYDDRELKRFFEKEILPKRKKVFHSTKVDISLSDLYKISKKYRCIPSVAHPFGYSLRTSLTDVFAKHEEILSRFDHVEAINGGNSRKHNTRAVEYIEKTNKKMTGGSDGHSLSRLGKVLTFAKAKSTKEFLDKIEAGDVMVVGTETKLGKFGEYANYAMSRMKGFFR